jgi:nitroreductase
MMKSGAWPNKRKRDSHILKELLMDLFSAIKDRRSCRNFSTEPLEDTLVERILDAAVWAPSPLNMQPWQFTIITGEEKKEAVFQEAERCRKWAVEASGWKWLNNYTVDFLKAAPVIVLVVGDSKKTGVDMFQKEGSVGYQLACGAAIQNMLLAAHAMGLGSLWFTFFDKQEIRKIFNIPDDKTPVAMVCIGKTAKDPASVPRKSFKDKIAYC